MGFCTHVPGSGGLDGRGRCYVMVKKERGKRKGYTPRNGVIFGMINMIFTSPVEDWSAIQVGGAI